MKNKDKILGNAGRSVSMKYILLLIGIGATHWWMRLLVSGIVAACLFSHTMTAHAFGTTQCAGSRYGADLNCTAGDVSITGMRVIGDMTSCEGGTFITVDLELTVNFAVPDRWDIGIFISNDGKDPRYLPPTGAASCSVGILPPSSPFLNLDSDGCGDGNKTDIGGGTGSGITYMTNVTVPCQAISGSGGNLYIPFVVSWNNQAGLDCYSIADPVPNTKAKCNAPIGEYFSKGIVQVVVLPTITKTDYPITTIKSGDTTNYTVVITNTTGATLTNAVFKDPAVTGINVSSVSCSASGGASCPGSTTMADMQGAGITIPSMPVGSSVTFTIKATLTGNPGDTRTNTASVTVGGQTKSASDTDTIVGAIAILPTSLSKSGSPGTLMVYNYTLYNFSGSDANISLSAASKKGWTVQLSTYSVTLSSGGSANFTLTVQIPSDASVDPPDGDTTTITATSSNPATAITTVLQPLTLTPDNTGSGGKGSSAFYDHRVQNNTASSQTVTFATVFSGTCTGVWTAIPPATVTLAAFGGYKDIVVQVNIPSGALLTNVCIATTTASAGTTASATDTTTVKDLVLYSDPGYTNESYIFPTGNTVYAMAFGLTVGTTYLFRWYDSSGLKQQRTKTPTGVPGPVPDYYDILVTGLLGTWRMEVWNQAGTTIVLGPVYFYVGPDHVNATYTGPYPIINNSVTIDLALHDRNHVVPIDPSSGKVVQGTGTPKDPLRITVTVSGSATIVSTTLTSCYPCTGQTVTGRLDDTTGASTGTATITITDSVRKTVYVTPSSYNSALYGSPSRDESTTVTFVKRMRIMDWREVVQ